jgi:stage V sporulation protein B
VFIITYYFKKRNIILLSFIFVLFLEAKLQKKIFISKVFGMSLGMLLLNISGICYNIYISSKLGAEGIGMFHLVMSVYSLALTIAVSGISLTATRLISDMPSPLAVKCADSIVIRCIRLIMLPAGFAFFALYFGSGFISQRILHNPDCALCLKLMAPTLMFSAVSSVINGYFTSFGKVASICFGKLISESVIWLSAFSLFKIFPYEKIYMAVVAALCMGVGAECLWNVCLWRKSRSFLYCTGGVTYREIINLCAPIAVGSYLRTGLYSLENLLIPSMLALFGTQKPLSTYGTVKGMTLSVLMFPTVFISAFNLLIVPEISRRRSLGYKNGIKYISTISLECVLKFAFLVSAIFFKWHSEIASSFFPGTDAGIYLGFLFLFPVFVFCDSVVDSILKGMDCQLTSLKINIIDSVCRVIFVLVFIPRFGIVAYIGIMYLSEIVNLSFSYIKLRKVSNVRFPFKTGVLIPFLCAFVSIYVMKFFPHLNVWAGICVMTFVYMVGLCIFSKIKELVEK